MDHIDLDHKPTHDELLCRIFIELKENEGLDKIAGRLAEKVSACAELSALYPNLSVQRLKTRVYKIESPYIWLACPAVMFEYPNVVNMLSRFIAPARTIPGIQKLTIDDIRFPDFSLERFPGPDRGSVGFKEFMSDDRRLYLSVNLEDFYGIDANEFAELVLKFFLSGADIVFEGNRIADQSINRFKERVMLAETMRQKAESKTGSAKIFIANVTADPHTMLYRSRFLRSVGAPAFSADMAAVGIAGVHALRNQELRRFIRADSSIFSPVMNNTKAVLSDFLQLKLLRLAGADIISVSEIDDDDSSLTENYSAFYNILTSDGDADEQREGGFPQRWTEVRSAVPELSISADKAISSTLIGSGRFPLCIMLNNILGEFEQMQEIVKQTRRRFEELEKV